MKKARARHILVKKEKRAKEILVQLQNGSDFADLAAQHSACPSGKSGGDLGSFGPGEMVAAFDEVVFKASPK